MIKIKLFCIAIFVFLIYGCSFKTEAKAPIKYDFYYNQQGCVAKINPKKIYIENVKALELVDTRQILVYADKNQIKYLNDARYASLPSEMFYKALLKGFYANCNAKPVFTYNKGDLKLSAKLLAMHARDNYAEISIAYELKQDEKVLKSGIIEKRNPFEDNKSSSTIFNAINKSSNEIIDELLIQIL
ncbi:ABC-type transport auxiliary lipoprotein family protein [Campylobacter pinnipediorum]|uniref:ABC-type transport auxiliary lipoprotein family protein n=1 Tax=Campylobacter pinnipediorum TaxID=1965231 RepID=UPI0009ADD619|nr:ABC-type transport auxiliary lipoprotein family protein [Campylobacter pinnipediorum]